MSKKEEGNRTIRRVLDGTTETGPASVPGGEVKTGDYEVTKQLKDYYKNLLRGRTFYSILNVVRRHRAAKRKAAATVVPAGA